MFAAMRRVISRLTATRDHTGGSLPTCNLDSFVDCPFGSDGSEALTAVHNRGGRRGSFDGRFSMFDDRADFHETKVVRNPDDAVRVVPHQAAGDKRSNGRSSLMAARSHRGKQRDASLRKTDSGR